MSEGIVFVVGPCICCNKVFGFNPHRVPSSMAVTGKREAVCQECMTAINAKREARGEPPFPVLPGAYEPMSEDEL